jgi:hypothetical protein
VSGVHLYAMKTTLLQPQWGLLHHQSGDILSTSHWLLGLWYGRTLSDQVEKHDLNVLLMYIVPF